MDEEKREIYDNYGREGLEEVLKQYEKQTKRMNSNQGKQKGQAVGQPLNVTLEELYCGATKHLAIKRTRICGVCDGSGASDQKQVENCDKCQGYGIVVGLQQVAPGFVQQVKQYCPDCYGKGKKVKEGYQCKTCFGSSIVHEDKVLKVKIEKGMIHGQQIPFENEGDEKVGINAGDIIVVLQQEKHAIFQRQGHNLVMLKKNWIIRIFNRISIQI